MLSQLKHQVIKLKEMVSLQYQVIFYLPYELYKTNCHIKSVLEHEINKNILHPHVKSIHIHQITETLYWVIIKTKDYVVYQNIKALLANYKELLPPWVAFPSMFQGCPRWNQGYEEDYCCNYWMPYWKSMSEEERNAYYTKHNAPQAWIDWLDTNEKVIHDTKPAGIPNEDGAMGAPASPPVV